jgi:hypothetical protein
MRIPVFALAMIAAASTAALGQEKLALDCAWISTFDTATMQTTATSGSGFYLLTFTSAREGTARKQGLGALFDFTADDVELVGETRYKIGGQDYSQTFRINRYTGKIEATFQIGKGGGLLHTGQCKTTAQRQF